VPIDYGVYQDGNQQTANYLRQALRRIGIEGELRNADAATWLRRKYGEGDFGISVFNASATVDPAIGLQRFWWSGAIQKGVSFTNTSGYSNPEMDKVLVAAASEPDAAKRKALYAEFQRIAMVDLPMIPVVELRMVTVASKRVRNHTTGPEGYRSTFADCWIAA
jgi:peptide/nickel transport system substrate-binding protein